MLYLSITIFCAPMQCQLKDNFSSWRYQTWPPHKWIRLRKFRSPQLLSNATLLFPMHCLSITIFCAPMQWKFVARRVFTISYRGCDAFFRFGAFPLTFSHFSWLFAEKNLAFKIQLRIKIQLEKMYSPFLKPFYFPRHYLKLWHLNNKQHGGWQRRHRQPS